MIALCIPVYRAHEAPNPASLAAELDGALPGRPGELVVALNGISAAQASQGLSIWSIMVFPALFTAGMTLLDTTDSILMLGAYGWAFVKPIRKLYYNMTITLVSVVVALLVGGIEALGLVADRLKLEGGFWNAVGELNDNFGALGFVIIGLFLVSWIVSVAIYRYKRYDDIEASAA